MGIWITDAPLGTTTVTEHQATLRKVREAVTQQQTGHSIHIKEMEVYVDGVIWRWERTSDRVFP